jgi:hypothetical protein
MTPDKTIQKILDLSKNYTKQNSAFMTKLIEKSLDEINCSINGQKYEIFYYCELIENFIYSYVPNE